MAEIAHVLIIYGKPKGHGKNRKNAILYRGYIAYEYRVNAKKAILNYYKVELGGGHDDR